MSKPRIEYLSEDAVASLSTWGLETRTGLEFKCESKKDESVLPVVGSKMKYILGAAERYWLPT